MLLTLVALGALRYSGMGEMTEAEASRQFEQGVYLQQSGKDLSGAAGVFRSLLGANPPAEIANKTRLRLAEIHLGLGDKMVVAELLEGVLKEVRGETPAPLKNTPERYGIPAFVALLDRIERETLTPPGRDSLIHAALRGIAGSFGKNGQYYPNTGWHDGPNMEKPKYGAGIALTGMSDGLHVDFVVRASSAWQNGVQPGWIITAIDGKSWDQFSRDQAIAVEAIRGLSGTAVTLTFRIPSGDERRMQLTRAEQKPSIDGVFSHRLNPDGSSCWMTDGEIATAVATSFYKAAGDHKHSVAEDLRAALAVQPAKAYLIDFRSTRGGGGLDGAAEVADLFLKKGLIARNSSRRISEEITARAENDLPEVPMAVLVNGATSFGAEIVAAALQDHRRAVVIGRRTAGRALVREYFEVPGAGSLILPVSEVFRSSGANLERLVHMTGNDTWGVIPDLIVPPLGAPTAETGTGNTFAPEENYQRLWDSTPADQRDAALKKDVQYQAALEYLRKELAKK